VRFPRAGLSALLPGGSGPKRPAGITTGLRVIPPAALGRPGVGNAHPYLVPSQEARELELSGGVRSRPQEPWWNAGRRARPRAEGRRKPPFRGAPCAPLAYRSWTTASAGVPLPLFLRFVGWVLLSLYPSYRSVPGLRSAPSGLQDTGRSTPLFDKTRALVRRGNGLLFRLCPAGRRSARFQRLA